VDTKPTSKPAGTPISKDVQLSALRQVVKKEEASVEMKQRDKNICRHCPCYRELARQHPINLQE